MYPSLFLPANKILIVRDFYTGLVLFFKTGFKKINDDVIVCEERASCLLQLPSALIVAVK